MSEPAGAFTEGTTGDFSGDKVHINRGTAVIARPGVGVQFGVLPHNAVVLPLPAQVSTGHVLTTFAAARLPIPRAELSTGLSYCGLSLEAAEDIVEELLRCGVLRGFPAHPSIPVLKSGSASDRQVAALRKEGFAAHIVNTPRELILGHSAGSVALLPGNIFLTADVHYMLMQAGISHLPSVAIDGAIILGPLVIPGVTPCLQCMDHSYVTQDEQWHSIRMQAAGRPISADPLHVEAAALTVASVVARHLMPWQAAGKPKDRIPELLRKRLEIRLGDAQISTTEVEFAPGCLTCQMTRTTPEPRLSLEPRTGSLPGVEPKPRSA